MGPRADSLEFHAALVAQQQQQSLGGCAAMAAQQQQSMSSLPSLSTTSRADASSSDSCKRNDDHAAGDRLIRDLAIRISLSDIPLCPPPPSPSRSSPKLPSTIPWEIPSDYNGFRSCPPRPAESPLPLMGLFCPACINRRACPFHYQTAPYCLAEAEEARLAAEHNRVAQAHSAALMEAWIQDEARAAFRQSSPNAAQSSPDVAPMTMRQPPAPLRPDEALAAFRQSSIAQQLLRQRQQQQQQGQMQQMQQMQQAQGKQMQQQIQQIQQMQQQQQQQNQTNQPGQLQSLPGQQLGQPLQHHGPPSLQRGLPRSPSLEQEGCSLEGSAWPAFAQVRQQLQRKSSQTATSGSALISAGRSAVLRDDLREVGSVARASVTQQALALNAEMVKADARLKAGKQPEIEVPMRLVVSSGRLVEEADGEPRRAAASEAAMNRMPTYPLLAGGAGSFFRVPEAR